MLNIALLLAHVFGIFSTGAFAIEGIQHWSSPLIGGSVDRGNRGLCVGDKTKIICSGSEGGGGGFY